jgi:hypothetical protein
VLRDGQALITSHVWLAASYRVLTALMLLTLDGSQCVAQAPNDQLQIFGG